MSRLPDHRPPNGLSNQRRDIATMVLIANVLAEPRKFVLPFLFTYGEDGSKMRFWTLGRFTTRTTLLRRSQH